MENATTSNDFFAQPEITPRSGVKFKGTGGKLFELNVIKIALSLITMGIYGFWGQVEIQKYMYSNTEFNGERFGYHATGWEKFRGFLIAFGLVLLYGGIFFGSFFYFGKSIPENQQQWYLLGYRLFTLFLIFQISPFILVGRMRFLLSRSSYRDVRFNFKGRGKTLWFIVLKGVIFTPLSLGLYWPVFYYNILKFYITNIRYGNEPFYFDGRLGEAYKIIITGMLLWLPTFGLYSFWNYARLNSYVYRNISIQEKFFECNLKGVDWLMATLYAMFITFFTLGFGAAWGVVKQKKTYLESIKAPTDIDFEKIIGDIDRGASAFSDGLSSALEGLGEFMP